MTKAYDVAIIGYGPTGATAANILGRQGLNVVIVDRDADVYNRARAISTDEEVMRIWQSVGLADRLQQDMLPGRPVAFVDAHGAPFMESVLPSKGSGHPPQQFLYQPAMDHVLREGVERFDNVTVLLEHECLRVLDRGDRVEVMLADLRTDTFHRLQASYIIAADGGSSAIRGALGIGYSGRTYGQRWVVIDTKVLKEWDSHDRLRFHCNPDQPTVDCPTPLGHHRWEYPAREDSSDEQLTSEDAIWKVLHGQAITEENVKVLRAVVYSHHVRVAERWRVGRVFLAGDAAHAMPPWIGQGMSAGVRDASNLSWKLASVLRGRAPTSLLDSYEAERKPHVTNVTRRATIVGRLITERSHRLADMRNRVLRRLTRLPGAIPLALKFLWIPDPRYRKGFLSRPGRAVGWLIPQPWITNGDTGAHVRFDDVLGGQWAVLHIGAEATGVDAWRRAGVQVIQVRDELAAWMTSKKTTAIAVRPDGYVYAAADASRPLTSPPAGFNLQKEVVTA